MVVAKSVEQSSFFKKSDNEAVGTVIAEFGNLDEISEDLGIGSFVKPSSAKVHF